LINATLEFAKEASARASRSLANRLKKISRELETLCSNVIKDVDVFKDDKNLVANRETTSRIHSLGYKLNALENNLIILEDEEIELEPSCCVISG
jgi:mRNA-degrading endonuclease RelE of RelBE toxin-antitoxin system